MFDVRPVQVVLYVCFFFALPSYRWSRANYAYCYLAHSPCSLRYSLRATAVCPAAGAVVFLDVALDRREEDAVRVVMARVESHVAQDDSILYDCPFKKKELKS